MNEQNIEVLSGAINRAVVCMPGRKFPGMVIQGDTLSSLYALSCATYQRAQRQDDNELIDQAGQMLDRLGEMLEEYEIVMKSHGRSLPYESPFIAK